MSHVYDHSLSGWLVCRAECVAKTTLRKNLLKLVTTHSGAPKEARSGFSWHPPDADWCAASDCIESS